MKINDKKQLNLTYGRIKHILNEHDNPYLVFSVLNNAVEYFLLKLPKEFRDAVYDNFRTLKDRVEKIENHEATIGEG